ncbi:MAG: hypothetical protein L3K17_06585 [Thermoplasmata archaeon]|nr:hypothetical protein [Thermoplasmata archaeon]
MNEPPAEDLRRVFADELGRLAAARSEIRLVETPVPSDPFEQFRASFPDRRAVCADAPGVTELLTRAIQHGHLGFAAGPAEQVVAELYPWTRQATTGGPGTFRLVSLRSGLIGVADPAVPPMLDDLSLMGGLAGMTVIAPCDGPTTREATRWLASSPSPAYLRLTEQPLARATEAKFEVGRARELRAGSDLTLLAVGTMVERALDAASELHRVGVAARVLDLSSVKPMDTKAILRAARDTGALLTLEEHAVATGVGSMVAALTAENYPVPVRRLGVPDLAGVGSTGADARDRFGLSRARILEEAWELLRIKGKVQ